MSSTSRTQGTVRMRFLSWIGLCLAVLALVSVSDAEEPLGKEFFIHYWWGPPTSGDLNQKYADVACANFTFAGTPGEGDAVHPDQSRAILDACQAHGIQHLVSDQRINPRITWDMLPPGAANDPKRWDAKKPGDPEFYPSLDAVIEEYANHPAFAGFYVADEPSASLFPWIAKINQYLRQRLPDKIIYISLLPNWAPQWLLARPSPEENPGEVITYEAYLEQFITLVKPQVLSYDNYAPWDGDPERLKSYFANFEIVREKGLKYGIPTCFVLSSQSPPQTAAVDIRWQINLALAYGFKGISYYTYGVPGEKPLALSYSDGALTDLYDEVCRINGQVRRLGPTLMKLTSVGVYHSAEVPEGCRPLDPGLPLRLQCDRPILLGMFKHEDGSDWIMPVNRDRAEPATVELAFRESVKSVSEIDGQTGNVLPLDLKEGSASFVLPPGQCKLIKLGNTSP